MSGYAPLQQALADAIKAEVQAAVAEKYQAEIEALRDALAIAQRDLNHTRETLDELSAAVSTAEGYITTIRTDLDKLRDDFQTPHDGNLNDLRAGSSSNNDTPITSQSDLDVLRDQLDNLRGPSSIADNDLTTSRADDSKSRGDNLPIAQSDAATVKATSSKANNTLPRVHMETGAVPFSIPVNTGVADDASPKPSEAALKFYAERLRLRFPNTYHFANKLCGTSDPWVVQELLNEGSICRSSLSFDSFGRLVLQSYDSHPIFEIVKKIDDWNHAQIAKHQLYKTIEKYAPGACILSPSRVYCDQTDEDVPVDSASVRLRRWKLAGTRAAVWLETAIAI
ncbi:hypothetical protein SLS53_004753 [Cytospora paraplurivora]|uniref:Uncharacterized protein n=1 Tax=Cytospora paraplurivora TaxID=2898453 RepID=A0AAN9U6S4_9PEZI